MELLPVLPAFALAVLVVWSVPGPAMLLVVRRAAVRGTRPVLATTAVLALVQVVLETLLHLPVPAGVARARGWFARSAVRRWLAGLSGTVLLARGVRVAATGR